MRTAHIKVVDNYYCAMVVETETMFVAQRACQTQQEAYEWLAKFGFKREEVEEQ